MKRKILKNFYTKTLLALGKQESYRKEINSLIKENEIYL